MNKNIIAALMALFVVFVGFQFAEPAAAVKVVDHGTKYGWNGQDGYTKVTWKTYQYNNNFLKTYATYYVKDPDTKKYLLSYHERYTIAKVTKKSVKITDWTDCELGPGPGTTISYDKTKYTASRYYWRIYRHIILNH